MVKRSPAILPSGCRGVAEKGTGKNLDMLKRTDNQNKNL